MTPDPTQPTLRERRRIAVRGEIVAAAMNLVAEQGYAATTIDQIAAAAGISRRTFFHHFPAKEDVVLGDMDAWIVELRDALEARPADEPAWTAIFEALKSTAPADLAQSQALLAQVYEDTPSLRASHLEKHYRLRAMLAPDIERRLGLPPAEGGDPRAQALVAAALSCFDVAMDTWRRSGATGDAEAMFLACSAAIRA